MKTPDFLNSKAILPFALAAALAGCADSTTSDEVADRGSLDLVMPGKADDYFSNVSKEYEVTGSVTVEMTEEEYADELLREQLVSQRISAVGVYLTTYFTDKFRGIDVDGDGEISDDEVFFENTDYGGFKAMVRNQSVEIASVEGSEGLYTASFTIDVAGPNNLLELLEAEGANRQTAGMNFDLVMPAGAMTAENGRPIRSFDPATYDGELESIPLEVVSLPDVSDAYPAYRDFFADGRYEITMIFGHDYNAARYDIQDAERAFEWLVDNGYKAPVSSFDELGSDSGTFTKTLTTFRPVTETCQADHVIAAVNDPALTESELEEMGVWAPAREDLFAMRAGDDGEFGTLDDVLFETLEDVDSVYYIGPKTLEKMKAHFDDACSTRQRQVRVDVRLFHSDMYVGDRQNQRDQAIYELTQRDVVFYNGHAGPYYGLYLDAGYEAYIDSSEFASLPFDERQQLFVAQGCQTYSQYADMLYAHPEKSESNLDVITTVNYSYARGTMDLFARLTQIDSLEGDVHDPASYNTIVTGLNDEIVNDYYNVFYGVIGIDQNEKLAPYADVSTIGETCADYTDCGDTYSGNVCAGFSDGTSRCVARTAAEAGCPDGSNYAYVAGDDWVLGGVCFEM